MAMMRKPSLLRHSSEVEQELNITPVMNLFVILIPFLLASAVFIQVTVIPNSIPNLDTAPTKAMQQQKKKSLQLRLLMNDKGYTVAAVGGVLDLGKGKKSQGTTIPKVNDEYDAATLNRVMWQIRKAYPHKIKDEPVILYPKATVKYKAIIHTMDALREAWDENGQVLLMDGQDEQGTPVKVPIALFPNVVIGAELIE